jgi:hypothetical protein
VLHVFFGESTDSRPSCELNLQVEELEPVGHERDVNLVHVMCDTIKVETSTRRASLLILKFGSSSMIPVNRGYVFWVKTCKNFRIFHCDYFEMES